MCGNGITQDPLITLDLADLRRKIIVAVKNDGYEFDDEWSRRNDKSPVSRYLNPPKSPFSDPSLDPQSGQQPIPQARVPSQMDGIFKV